MHKQLRLLLLVHALKHCRLGGACVLNIGGASIFWLFPTTGMCSGHALQTCVCFWTSQTSQTSLFQTLVSLDWLCLLQVA
jgi:hypothetical protein